ncbi:MAG: ABC transporter permease, partial [Pseudomonadota bacterium]
MAITALKPQGPEFVVPIVAAFGAFAGLFIGTSQGSGLLGILGGAVVMGAIAFALLSTFPQRRPAKWLLIGAFAVLGLFFAGVPGVLVGALFGWFFGWLIFWLAEGQYRAGIAPYATP